MSLFFIKQKTAYEMRISDWSSDVCSSDLTSFVATYRGSFCRGQSPSASIILTLRSPRYDLSAGGAYVHVPPSLNKWRSITRSEERRVGKECVSRSRSRCSP